MLWQNVIYFLFCQFNQNLLNILTIWAIRSQSQPVSELIKFGSVGQVPLISFPAFIKGFGVLSHLTVLVINYLWSWGQWQDSEGHLKTKCWGRKHTRTVLTSATFFLHPAGCPCSLNLHRCSNYKMSFKMFWQRPKSYSTTPRRIYVAVLTGSRASNLSWSNSLLLTSN